MDDNMDFLKGNYDRAMKFADNFQSKHPGVSNLYVFTAVDKDGNIVDEKYGMNIMTNYGFSTLFANANTTFKASDNVKLYVGEQPVSQDQPINTDSTPQIYTPLFGKLAATNSNTSYNYEYPMYFASSATPGMGLITLISRFMICYYDFNISNYTGRYAIYEYGIGTAWNALWTHSHVYNMQGEPSAIYKDPSVKLYITVYMCLSLYENVITSGWSRGCYLAITTNAIMYNHMRDNKVSTYKRGNKTTTRTVPSNGRTTDTANPTAFVNSTIISPFTMYDGSNDTSGYFDGWIISYDGFQIIEPQFLDVPEDVTLLDFRPKTPYAYDGYATKFGNYPDSGYTKEEYPQMTHFTNARGWMFDWKQRDWLNELDLYNPDNKWYDETPSQTSCGLPIYYSNRGEILSGYLYQNLKPDDPILAINGSITVYATNKYWSNVYVEGNTDPDAGWVWVRDYNNIPQACQTARYWITETNVSSLTFTRQSDCFYVKEKGTNNHGFVTYTEFTKGSYIKPQCDNYEYEWYKWGNKIYQPTIRQIQTVGSDGVTGSESFTYGKYLLTVCSENNRMYLTDCSNAKTTGIAAGDTQTITTIFSTSINMLNGTYRTDSEKGIILFQSTTTDECVVVDLRSNSFSQTLKSWNLSCVIWGTELVAYTETGDNRIFIYSFLTNSIIKELDFPSGVSSIPFMFGHSHYVWISDGSQYGYYYDINAVTPTPIPYGVSGSPYTTDYQDIRFACVDDVFILYNVSECGSSHIPKAHYYLLSNPGNPIAMTDFNYNVSTAYIGGRIDFRLRYLQRDVVNNKGTLILLIVRGYDHSSSDSRTKGSDNRLFDFGRYLVTGDVTQAYESTGYEMPNWILYGENIIHENRYKKPLTYFVPMKLTGKTDTVTAQNNIKNVTGKGWTISYTNIPLWGYEINGNGKPPGIPLAKTDASGAITGWS